MAVAQSAVVQPAPQRQLARYLQRHGTAPARRKERNPIRESLTRRQDRTLTRGDPDYARALAYMRRAWQGARGYFPDREMPVPRFAEKGDAYGSVGWARNPRSEPVPVGITVPRGMAQMLGSRIGKERDAALLTLLHEWAHNFQKPSLYARRDQGSKVADARIEGGAEAFSHAAAPQIARLAGLQFNAGGATLRDSIYRPQTLAAVRKKGMGWIMRGQFGGS